MLVRACCLNGSIYGDAFQAGSSWYWPVHLVKLVAGNSIGCNIDRRTDEQTTC